MSIWLFVLLVNLPAFGGDVTATFRANGWDACDRLRTTVVEALHRQTDIRGTVTRCGAATQTETSDAATP